jgi:hypothetical protein
MLQPEILKRVAGALQSAGIPYMLTGSIVSSLQGEPRSTHDIDVVILVSGPDLAAITAAFPPPEFFLDPDSARAAVRTKSSFNVIDLQSGYKIDFYPLTRHPFDESRFSRRYLETFQDVSIYVSSPEDTILMKLHWADLSGGSEKQFTDALRVYEVQADGLNRSYIDEWASRLGISAAWAHLQKEADR